MKALQKGLEQLCEEGATQLFRPLRNNDLILGAVGMLQFDVVAFRLQDEYGVEAASSRQRAHRALGQCADAKKLEEFREKAYDNLGARPHGALVYLAPSRVNLQLTLERWPDIRFRETREHLAGQARVKACVPPPAGARLGALRLGQLGVRDHGDGRVLPGVLPAVLEPRRRSDREHVPARLRQRHRRPRGRAAGADARRDRGPQRLAQALAARLDACSASSAPPGCAGRGAAATGCGRRCSTASASLGFAAASSSTTRCCWTSREPEDTTASRPSAMRWATSAAACCSRSTC